MGFLDHEGGVELDDVFEALVEAIPTIKGMKIDKTNKLSGHILAKAGVSLRSWGENIPISLVEVSFGRTRISVTSTPKTGALFGGAFDLGKNRRNIESILEATSKILSRKLPVKADTASPQKNNKKGDGSIKGIPATAENKVLKVNTPKASPFSRTRTISRSLQAGERIQMRGNYFMGELPS